MKSKGMKTLANCKPSEFLKQTNLIRKSVEKWLTDTDIMNIRNRLPYREIVPLNATDEERQEINERNLQAVNDQIKKNGMAILDAIMEDHADETLEILALCCFIEPDHVDDYKVTDYLNAFNEILGDESVISFFTSLARLGQMNTRKA